MDLPMQIYSAKRFLVLRDYKTSIEKCEEGLGTLQNEEEIESRRGRDDCDVQKANIAFGVLGLQGLTLSGRHNELDTFAGKWFGCSRSFPPEILQICACHHLQMQEHEAALNLVEDWLSVEHNFKSNGFDKVAELYVRHILLPMKEMEKAECFLRESKTISSDNKQRLLIYIEKMKKETITQVTDYQNTDDQTELYSSTSSSNTVNSKDLSSRGPSLHGFFLKVVKLFTTVKQILINNASMKRGITSCGRLAVLAFFLYIIIIRTYLPGDAFSSRGSSSSLWNAVKQAWSALFAPYHLIQAA